MHIDRLIDGCSKYSKKVQSAVAIFCINLQYDDTQYSYLCTSTLLRCMSPLLQYVFLISVYYTYFYISTSLCASCVAVGLFFYVAPDNARDGMEEFCDVLQREGISCVGKRACPAE
jgi:hypothetical protein